MPACPMVTAKLKNGESAEKIDAEQMRRAHIYKNDVDLTKSHENVPIWYRLEDHEIKPAFDEAIRRRLGELKTRRKVRRDAVKALGILISCNGHLEGPEAIAYLERCADWLAARYGRENVLQAVIHMDEGTPHLHFWFMPVIHDARTGFDTLSAKRIFSPNIYEKVNGKRVGVKEEGLNSILQREFYEQVASKYGFDKPLTWDERFQDGIEYKSADEYKADQARQRAEQAAADAHERAAIAEGAADEQLGVFVKATAEATKAEAERDALKDEVNALHGERRQAVEATKAARAAQADAEAAQEKAEQAAHSAREAADRASQELTAVNNDLADTRAAVDGARAELATTQADTAAEAARLAATKAAADEEARRLEGVRREGKSADGRVSDLEKAIALERCRIESESRIAGALGAEGQGGRGAAGRIAAAVERGQGEAERAENRAGELERDVRDARARRERLDEQHEQWRAAVGRAHSDHEQRVGRRAGEIEQGRAELHGRVAAARTRFENLVGQVCGRIENGLTAATEKLYNAAKKALRMVAGNLPDTRLADGLTAAYEAADAAVKPEMAARADVYRRDLRRAIAEFEMTAQAAEGTTWRKFPKFTPPRAPEIVGSAAKAAADDRKRAARRADALRRRYATHVPDDDGVTYGRRGGDDGPAVGQSHEQSQSRSRSR